MKRVSFCTLGCRVNQYESRAIAELFIKQGYEIVEFGTECDICVVNTCAVTAESERKSAQMIRRASNFAKDVRVCGCFSERKKEYKNEMLFISKRLGCIGKTAIADTEPLFTEKGYELANIATVPADSVKTFSASRAFVKIQDGCLGKCTYCIIPALRGPVRSRPLDDIICEVERLVDGGCKEIILTGIETAAYNDVPLYQLIAKVASVNGLQRIRLGSLTPNALNERFIETVANTTAVMPHFHISLQSGCERILKLMQRPYTVSDAKTRIEALKAAIPNVQLSADIICSFPTETEDELEETLNFVTSIRFSHIHAFSYSKRPGTPAAYMEGQIPEAEKKQRIRHFSAECKKMESEVQQSRIGSYDTVLIEQCKSGFAYGHTEDFLEAKIKESRPLCVGDFIKVHIEGSDGKHLICSF